VTCQVLSMSVHVNGIGHWVSAPWNDDLCMLQPGCHDNRMSHLDLEGCGRLFSRR
jgi:hypothetical protein